MFYFVNGELEYCDLNTCVIDCGGVGYKLTVSQNTSSSLLSKVGLKVKLFTILVVREDGIELFGFSSNEERECFNNLTSVSGVGPKVAMSILSYMTPDNLALAICTDDIRSISKCPGIGPKSAARIVLELKDKMSKNLFDDKSSGSKLTSSSKNPSLSGNISEASEALMVLGYDKSTIISALRGVDPTMDAADIIKAVLKKLAR